VPSPGTGVLPLQKAKARKREKSPCLTFGAVPEPAAVSHICHRQTPVRYRPARADWLQPLALRLLVQG